MVVEDSGLLYFIKNIRPYQIMLLRSILPFVLLAIFNILIMAGLVKQEKKINKATNQTSINSGTNKNAGNTGTNQLAVSVHDASRAANRRKKQVI